MRDSTLSDRLAPYYAPRRSAHPDTVFAELGIHCGLDRIHRVLDLGCGPGVATFPLARRVRSVVAVDPDPGMLAEGRRQALHEGVDNVSWHEGSAETLEQFEPGQFDLAMMVTSFHRMDRAATLRTLDRVIAPAGAVASIYSMSSAASEAAERPAWVDAVVRSRRRWIPLRRRWLGDNMADASTYAVVRREHDAFLHRSAFCDVECFEVRWERRHDLDSLVGLQLTVPDATPSALGDRLDGFVADLRGDLLRTAPDGAFVEPMRTEVRIGRRPR